ncbi:hypothetical protein LIER_43759 [Lithospermum erythrorhizon]|uniref:Uncharacterized protein n=1 Tax=Lithospermum erythrorhizon TaxID=34254 RepID=A0AAV3QR24_LITER
MVCTYCHRTGHVEAIFYSKHGFPNQPKQLVGCGILRTPPTKPVVAAGRGGHGGRGLLIHSVQAIPDATVHTIRGGSSGTDCDGVLPGSCVSELTDTQWNNLLQLLGNSETSSVNRLNGKFFVNPCVSVL